MSNDQEKLPNELVAQLTIEYNKWIDGLVTLEELAKLFGYALFIHIVGTKA